jgi:hypothetical protein
VLVGEAGVGKTRLLREVREWCTILGAVALVGRAVETATAIRFRPLTEAMLGAHRSGRVDDDPDVAPFRGALARLVPGSTTADPAVSLLHVAEGFLRVARARGRAGRGTAVLLDDLHWADAETMAVVEYLGVNVRDEPVLLVAAARADGGTVAGLSSLVDRRTAALLELRRLGPDDTAAMTRDCLGDAAVPAQVLRLVADRADGLPFFVEELLAGLRSDGTLIHDGDHWVVRRSPAGDHRPHCRSRCVAGCALWPPSSGESSATPPCSAGPSTPCFSRTWPGRPRKPWTPHCALRVRSPCCRPTSSASVSDML